MNELGLKLAGGSSFTPAYDYWLPSGTLFETVPLGISSTATLTLTSGTLMCAAPAVLRKGKTYTGLTFNTGGTGLTTPTHQWAALVRLSDRQVLAVSADK